MDTREAGEASQGQYQRSTGSWSPQNDTGSYYDGGRDVGPPRGYGSRPPAMFDNARGGRGSRGRGRGAKGYRKLWEHVKSVGRGDTLDTDGSM